MISPMNQMLRTKTRQMMINLRVITRIATKKEFKALLPQPSSKDCWGNGPRTSKNWKRWLTIEQPHQKKHPRSKEIKRLSDAVEAATSTEQNSLGLLQAFMGQSGDPTISTTFRDIHMEAVTLLSARNDATRRATRAKEAAEMEVSKQGLAKDPAALAAANKLHKDWY